MINFSLLLSGRTPLYRDIQEKVFLPADELENLREEHRLLTLLEDGPILYDGFHDFVEFRVRGTLPKDKPKMLQKLESAIKQYQDRPPLYAFFESP